MHVRSAWWQAPQARVDSAGSATSSGARVLIVGCALIAPIAAASRLSAQVPTPTAPVPPATSVIGLVSDSLSGSFVAGAQITVVGSELATSTDPQGRFALRIPLGPRRILVVRPGYEDLEAVVQVTDPMGGLLLKLVPDLTAGGDSVDVSGVVTDAASGAPIAGADVSFGERGPRTTTNPAGRFVVRNAPTGRQSITVRRFGYRSREAQVEVRIGMRDPAIELTPDPVQLEALMVAGDELSNVRGRVVDALSEAPVPHASITVTRDGFTRVGRVAASEPNGAFTVDDIKFGGYLLKVERLGYFPVYVGFSHPSPEGLVVRLDPNAAMLAGVEAVADKLRVRTRAFANRSFEFTEKRIRDCRARSLEELVDRCGGGIGMGTWVYIDEVLFPPDASNKPFTPDLAGYHPNDFFRIEIYVCPPKGTAPPPPMPAGRGGAPPPAPPSRNVRHVEAHYFTYEYIERLAGRPRGLIDPCL